MDRILWEFQDIARLAVLLNFEQLYFLDISDLFLGETAVLKEYPHRHSKRSWVQIGFVALSIELAHCLQYHTLVRQYWKTGGREEEYSVRENEAYTMLESVNHLQRPGLCSCELGMLQETAGRGSVWCWKCGARFQTLWTQVGLVNGKKDLA